MSSPRDTTVTVLLDHHIPTPTVFCFVLFFVLDYLLINHMKVLFIHL
jgi:hypothetical protein